MTFPTCKTCRYWSVPGVLSDDSFGTCGMIHEDSALMVGENVAYLDLSKAEKDAGVRLVVPGGGLDLRTAEGFGCALHNPRDS